MGQNVIELCIFFLSGTISTINEMTIQFKEYFLHILRLILQRQENMSVDYDAYMYTSQQNAKVMTINRRDRDSKQPYGAGSCRTARWPRLTHSHSIEQSSSRSSQFLLQMALAFLHFVKEHCEGRFATFFLQIFSV